MCKIIERISKIQTKQLNTLKNSMISRLKISRKLQNFRLSRGELRITIRQDQTTHIFSEMSLVDTLDVSYEFFCCLSIF